MARPAFNAAKPEQSDWELVTKASIFERAIVAGALLAGLEVVDAAFEGLAYIQSALVLYELDQN